ncbi:MAG: glycoside hydrolase family 9 protein [Terriglobia bacterium]
MLLPLAIGSIAFFPQMCLGRVRVLVDQVGYELLAPKRAIIEGDSSDHPKEFKLVDASTGKALLSGKLTPDGQVYDWGGRVFWTADFSSWRTPGHYEVAVREHGSEARSCAFAIQRDVLERNTISNVIYYFKGQRSTGLIDRADSHLAIPGHPGRFVNLRGGWYDATGDYGIHFSQLNLTSYFNTQQVPLVAWSLLASYNELKARGDFNFSEYERRLLDGGLFGADFLVRMKRPHGSFFESIAAPGKLKLPQDRRIGNPNGFPQGAKRRGLSNSNRGVRPPSFDIHERPITGDYAYETSFRSGGGMAIAALALASAMPADGDFPRATYRRDAEEAFQFLQAHNRELLNDGTENILDDYCALMAATELYKATRQQAYLAAARKRAGSLTARLISSGKYHDYWRADSGTRPYFNPSDAGLPVISLLEYSQIAAPSERERTLETVERSLGFELSVTSEVNNPFGYARQLVRMGNGQVRTAFFFPHNSEAGWWWQGENARIASLAAAARMAAPLFASNPQFQAQLETYAWHQLHWILGRNPFDACMLNGSGHGAAPYMFLGSYRYTNAPGSIVNGITAAFNSEDGITYNEGYAVTGKDDDWRWDEQWLPHAAWYLFAVSLTH